MNVGLVLLENILDSVLGTFRVSLLILLWPNIHGQYCISVEDMITTPKSKDKSPPTSVSSQEHIPHSAGFTWSHRALEKPVLQMSLKICLENLNTD